MKHLGALIIILLFPLNTLLAQNITVDSVLFSDLVEITPNTTLISDFGDGPVMNIYFKINYANKQDLTQPYFNDLKLFLLVDGKKYDISYCLLEKRMQLIRDTVSSIIPFHQTLPLALNADYKTIGDYTVCDHIPKLADALPTMWLILVKNVIILNSIPLGPKTKLPLSDL